MIKIAQSKYLAKYDQLEPICNFMEQHVVKLGIPSSVVYDLVWSLNEIVTNVIEHGYKGEAGIVEITLSREGSDFILQVRDEAPVFDPDTVPQPDLTLALSKRPMGGLGLYVTKKLVDSLSHRSNEKGGNEITLVKRNILSD
jgi:serine/threonine-protein kinase RsbW